MLKALKSAKIAKKCKNGGGGSTNERQGSDQVNWRPMRSLLKITWKGERQTDIRKSRLYERICLGASSLKINLLGLDFRALEMLVLQIPPSSLPHKRPTKSLLGQTLYWTLSLYIYGRGNIYLESDMEKTRKIWSLSWRYRM